MLEKKAILLSGYHNQFLCDIFQCQWRKFIYLFIYIIHYPTIGTVQASEL